MSSSDRALSFFHVGSETPSEMMQATVNLQNSGVLVRNLMRVWPHSSLSGKNCGKLTRELSCCYPGFLRNMVSLMQPFAFFLVKEKDPD